MKPGHVSQMIARSLEVIHARQIDPAGPVD